MTPGAIDGELLQAAVLRLLIALCGYGHPIVVGQGQVLLEGALQPPTC
jgi:hypothetical protein